MGIYLPNMEMPKGCGNCPIGVYGDCDAVSPRKKLSKKYRWSADERPEWCPLVPVPPHGRLIDANALVADTSFYDGGDWHYGYSAKQIDNAPTILEAEGE